MTETRTILDLFDPPEGYRGRIAALISMSASTGRGGVVREALTRFAGSERERLTSRQLVAVLMRDGSPEASGRDRSLGAHEIPGVIELHPRPARNLLHAKLVMLGFTGPDAGPGAPPDLVRLIVSTGNLTNDSARRKLELVWSIDVDARSEAIERIDLAAAAKFVRRLIDGQFFLPSDAAALRPLWQMLDRCSSWAPSRAREPRFIHSLDEDLFSQISARLPNTPSCRMLLCGSGSFELPRAESSHRGGQIPAAEIPYALRRIAELPCFTNRPRRVLVVNPASAGAVAQWAPTATQNWTITQAVDVGTEGATPRALHAKFIFCGNTGNNGSDQLASGTLYLGSGNLSQMGLHSNVSTAYGNIECGVVIDVDRHRTLKDLFFDQKHAELLELQPGTDPDDEPDGARTNIDSPPILWAQLHGEVLTLCWINDDAERHRAAWIRLGEDEPPVRIERGQQPMLRDAVVPAALFVSREEHEGPTWKVPVFTREGELAAPLLSFASADDALASLLDFPPPADDAAEDDETDPLDPELAAASALAAPDDHGAKAYPLHTAATFIERLADHQVRLEPAAVTAWIQHLRVHLMHWPLAQLASWRDAELNVLDPLHEEHFCPRTMTDDQRSAYRTVLAEIRAHWDQALARREVAHRPDHRSQPGPGEDPRPRPDALAGVAGSPSD